MSSSTSSAGTAPASRLTSRSMSHVRRPSASSPSICIADALAHTRSELEVAEMLWVDVDTLRTRLIYLDDVERARLGLTHDLAC